MSRHFGAIRQIAFVVRDLPRTLRYWTEVLGIGPFFVTPKLTPIDFIYKGVAVDPPEMTLAFAYSGELQIEIVCQHNNSPSGYRDFLVAGREGLQHISSWHTPADYDLLRGRLSASGAPVIHEGRIANSGVRFCYLATDTEAAGVVFEISDILAEPLYSRFQAMAKVAQDWTGSSPIRNMAGDAIPIESLA